MYSFLYQFTFPWQTNKIIIYIIYKKKKLYCIIYCQIFFFYNQPINIYRTFYMYIDFYMYTTQSYNHIYIHVSL